MSSHIDEQSRVDGCERLHRSLCECHRRVPAGPPREAACRHLNRSLAECLVSIACPSEMEAVRTLCSSGGTSLKRSQCQQAQLSLSTAEWITILADLHSLLVFDHRKQPKVLLPAANCYTTLPGSQNRETESQNGDIKAVVLILKSPHDKAVCIAQ